MPYPDLPDAKETERLLLMGNLVKVAVLFAICVFAILGVWIAGYLAFDGDRRGAHRCGCVLYRRAGAGGDSSQNRAHPRI